MGHHIVEHLLPQDVLLRLWRGIAKFTGIQNESLMLKFLEVLDKKRTNLNSQFVTLRGNYHNKWKLFVVVEEAMIRGRVSEWVVLRESAKVGVDKDEFHTKCWTRSF